LWFMPKEGPLQNCTSNGYVMGNGIKPSKYFAKTIASLDYQVKLPHIWSLKYIEVLENC
jgi:hypothetical protein